MKASVTKVAGMERDDVYNYNLYLHETVKVGTSNVWVVTLGLK